MAIKYGFQFQREDFALIARSPGGGGFNFAYWGGSDRHMLGERFYTLAVEGANRYGPNQSAALAFEHWVKRKPYLIRRAPEDKIARRIAIGVRFSWYDELLTCTSFSEDGQSLTACSYKGAEYEYCPKCNRCIGGGQDGLLHRVRITHADIREYHRAIVRTTGVVKRINGLSEAKQKTLYHWLEKRFAEHRKTPKPKELDVIEAQLDKVA